MTQYVQVSDITNLDGWLGEETTMVVTSAHHGISVGMIARLGDRRMRVVRVDPIDASTECVHLVPDGMTRPQGWIVVDDLHDSLIPEKVVAHAKARDEFLGSLRKRRGGW